MEDIPSCCPLYKGSSGLCPANISRSDAIIKLELCVSIFMFIHYLHIIPDISIREMAAHFFFFNGSFPNCKKKHVDFSGVHWRAEQQKKHLAVFREIYNKKVILFFSNQVSQWKGTRSPCRSLSSQSLQSDIKPLLPPLMRDESAVCLTRFHRAALDTK